MDGVEELIGVTVIGATNRPEALVSYPFPCCTASPPPPPSHFEMLVLGSSGDTSRKARSYFIRGTTGFHWSRRCFSHPHAQHGRRPCARSRCACYPRASTLFGFTEFKMGLSQTSGCSGAEITAICQEAALIAMREDINAPFVSSAFLHALNFNITNW